MSVHSPKCGIQSLFPIFQVGLPQFLPFLAPPGWDLCLSHSDPRIFQPLQAEICAFPAQTWGFSGPSRVGFVPFPARSGVFPALTCRSKALEEKAGMWQDRMGHQKGARLFLSSSGQSQPGWFSSPAEIQDQGSPSAQTPPLGSIPAPIQWIWDALHPLLRIVAVCRGKKSPKNQVYGRKFHLDAFAPIRLGWGWSSGLWIWDYPRL